MIIFDNKFPMRLIKLLILRIGKFPGGLEGESLNQLINFKHMTYSSRGRLSKAHLDDECLMRYYDEIL